MMLQALLEVTFEDGAVKSLDVAATVWTNTITFFWQRVGGREGDQ